MLFCVRVRLDEKRVPELGRRLAAGELDRSAIRVTFCHADDPAVGLSIWEVADRADLDRRLAPFLPYDQEVREVTAVVDPAEAQRLLMARRA